MKLYDVNKFDEYPNFDGISKVFNNNVKIKYKEFLKMLKDRGECYIDAYRIVELINKNAKPPKEYLELNTCCGSEDIVIMIDDVYYMMGANYGH